MACAAAAAQAGGLIAPAASYYGSYGYGWNPYSNYPAQPAIASQHSNILRSPFNLGQVGTFEFGNRSTVIFQKLSEYGID